MPVYSEVLSDQEILKTVRNCYQNVLVIGCGSCMNESLSYLHDLPIFTKDNNGNNVPFSVLSEKKRIVDMLNNEGFHANYQALLPHSNTLCQIDNDKEIYQLSVNSDTEIVLAVCCPAGIIGLKTGVEIPIIRITKQKGFLAYRHTDDSDGVRRMIQEHSKVLGYSKD
jgi:hypothetical protein